MLYITANNSGFTGAVNISSKVNIGNGSNLGTGLITLNTGNGLILGSTTLNNAFSIASASSFTVNAGETANLTGAFSGTNPITVSSNPANRGILKLSGASSGYTGAIGATNINLLINGPTGATVNAGTNSVIGGTGSMGDLALTNSAIIKPGTETALGSISASTLTTDSGARYYVRIGADGRSSQINVTGNTTLTNLATDLLMGAGIYASGATTMAPVVINYPIMITGGTLTGDITDITWTAQAGLTIDVGRAATNNKAILLKLTATAPFTIGANQTAPGASTDTIAPGHTIAIGSNDTTAPVSITSGGSVSTATLTTGTPIDLAGGTLANTTAGTGGSAKVLGDAITISGISTLQTNTGSETKITAPITSGSGTTLNISGGGITTFSANNSTTLQGNIAVTAASSIINVANGANLGTGEFKLAAPGTTVNLGDATGINPTVAIKNTVVVDNAASFVVPTDVVATIEKVIAGSSVGGVAPDLTFSGPGKTNLTGTGTSTYDGTLRATSGNLAVNSDMRLADVNVSSGAIVSGTGTMKNLVLASGATFKPGNSIGTTPITGNYTAASGSITTIEINNAGQSSRGVVSGNIDLQGTHILKILMNTDNGGAYPAGKIDFNILEAGGTLTINQFDVRFVPQTGMTFKIGKLNQPGSAKDHKALVLQYENTGAPIAIGTTQVDGDLPGGVNTIVAGDITIDSTDIVSPDSGLGDVSTAPIADQVELTNLVFQNNPTSDDAVSSAVGDAFRFKGFSSSKTPSVSGKKDAIETLLTALSKNGPVAYEKNETRLSVSPYANRSRTNRTNSDSGNQGWSGGSLVGVEQRDKKNIWSLGLLTGLMGSRSHVLGTPDTFSKTNGFLIGAFNTYKYTQEWGHEVLISRTNTFIDAQRYGLDRTDKQTPYYALATYKSTTDVGNGQINYLFNIIKKKITCRLSTGITYLGTQTGKITERNAGANALSSAASNSKSSEIYTGIGLRRIWDVDKITVRTTFVYEYGYEFMKKGSGITTTTQSLTQSTAPTTFTTPHGSRQNKHYIQLNSSYLDRNTGLKFILSYSGALYKNVRNHTGMAKVEYRF